MKSIIDLTLILFTLSSIMYATVVGYISKPRWLILRLVLFTLMVLLTFSLSILYNGSYITYIVG